MTGGDQHLRNLLEEGPDDLHCVVSGLSVPRTGARCPATPG